MWEAGISVLKNSDYFSGGGDLPLKSAYFNTSQILYRFSHPANIKVRVNIN